MFAIVAEPVQLIDSAPGPGVEISVNDLLLKKC